MEEKAKRFNKGKPQYSLIHYKSLEPLVRTLEYGRHKYSIYIKEGSPDTLIKGENIPYSQKDEYIMVEDARNNWMKKMPLKEIEDSMQRHYNDINDGVMFDKESGVASIGCLMANCMFWNYHQNKQDEE